MKTIRKWRDRRIYCHLYTLFLLIYIRSTFLPAHSFSRSLVRSPSCLAAGVKEKKILSPFRVLFYFQTFLISFCTLSRFLVRCLLMSCGRSERKELIIAFTLSFISIRSKFLPVHDLVFSSVVSCRGRSERNEHIIAFTLSFHSHTIQISSGILSCFLGRSLFTSRGRNKKKIKKIYIVDFTLMSGGGHGAYTFGSGHSSAHSVSLASFVFCFVH